MCIFTVCPHYRMGKPCCGTWTRASTFTPWTVVTPSMPFASAPTATGCVPPLDLASRSGWVFIKCKDFPLLSWMYFNKPFILEHRNQWWKFNAFCKSMMIKRLFLRTAGPSGYNIIIVLLQSWLSSLNRIWRARSLLMSWGRTSSPPTARLSRLSALLWPGLLMDRWVLFTAAFSAWKEFLNSSFHLIRL